MYSLTVKNLLKYGNVSFVSMVNMFVVEKPLKVPTK